MDISSTVLNVKHHFLNLFKELCEALFTSAFIHLFKVVFILRHLLPFLAAEKQKPLVIVIAKG